MMCDARLLFKHSTNNPFFIELDCHFKVQLTFYFQNDAIFL